MAKSKDPRNPHPLDDYTPTSETIWDRKPKHPIVVRTLQKGRLRFKPHVGLEGALRLYAEAHHMEVHENARGDLDLYAKMADGVQKIDYSITVQDPDKIVLPRTVEDRIENEKLRQQADARTNNPSAEPEGSADSPQPPNAPEDSSADGSNSDPDNPETE